MLAVEHFLTVSECMTNSGMILKFKKKKKKIPKIKIFVLYLKIINIFLTNNICILQ